MARAEKDMGDKKININSILNSLDLEIVKEDRNDFLVVCPFHEDKNPSLRIHKEKFLVHCFAECIKGDIFDLIAKVLNVSRKDAIKRYRNNNLFNYETWENQFCNRLKNFIKVQKPQEYPIVLNDYVLATKEIQSMNYLLSRGLTKEIIKKSKILYNINYKEVAIPLFSRERKLLTLINRSIEKKEYRYLKGFPITNYFYGLHFLNDKSSECYLVEGGFDQLKLYQYGIPNVLALMHSDISQKQVEELKKYFNVINLILDGDEVGRNATRNIASKLRKEGFLVYDIQLENNRDPDEYSKEELEDKIQNKKLISLRGE